jgi:hypothetical protein
LITRNVLIFFILVCTISCTGKKEEENTPNKNSLITKMTEATDPIDHRSDWVISDDFSNVNHNDTIYGYKVDYENKMTSQIINDILTPYKRTKGVYHL